MKEIEQYISYIKAKRLKNKEALAILSRDGFTFDRNRFIELSLQNKPLHDCLYNKAISVHLDVNSTFGHVFIEGPYFNVETKSFETKAMGQYDVPSLFSQKHGLADDSDRLKKDQQHIHFTLPITEEAWHYLGHFMQMEQERLSVKNDYNLFLKNCAVFVDLTLKKIGVVDGLLDKFDVTAFAALPAGRFTVVKPFLLNYFRVSKAAQFTSFIEDIALSTNAIQNPGFSVDVYTHLVALSGRFPQYEEERKMANLQTNINFVDSFIVGEEFYRRNFTSPMPTAELPTTSSSQTIPEEVALQPQVEEQPLNQMEQSAFDGFQLAAELVAQQGMLFGFSNIGPLSTETEMKRNARELMVYSNAAFAEAEQMVAQFQKHGFY